MRLIWATRGREWGFAFLATGGMPDPLLRYEQVMTALDGVRRGVARVDDAVALKFEDPEGRLDRSGRVIPHRFVVFGELADHIGSVEDGLREVWPLVAEHYAEVWDQPKAPTTLM